ncbi:MAG: alpha/beta hydrolase family protein [Stackebrandtia sp.]
MNDAPANNAVSRWIGRMPGHERLIRINVPTQGDVDARFDVPSELHFGLKLHPVLPLDPESMRDRIREYTDGEISIVVSMVADAGVGDSFAFYADIDHDAVVPLFQISADTFLSEQGEELTFTEDGKLRMSIEDASVEMWEAKSPVAEEVTFPVSDASATLSGTLLRPHGADPGPALVVAHGSLFHQRDVYRVFAHAMVRVGMSVLIFDRQGYGKSGGEPAPSLRGNAEGIEAALDFLAARDDVTTTGLWGVSNGMWTVPLVASRRPDVAFVAGLGSPGVTAVEAETHRRGAALAAGGTPPEAVETARQAWRLLLKARADGGADDKTTSKLEQLLKRLRDEPSLSEFEVPAYAQANPALSPVPPLAPAAETVAGFDGEEHPDALYDPVNSYREISCPVLLQYGAQDANVPAAVSAERIGEALAKGGNKQTTITSYDGAGHLLDVVPDRVEGMSREQAEYLMHAFRFTPGALGELTSWMETTASSVEPKTGKS